MSIPAAVTARNLSFGSPEVVGTAGLPGRFGDRLNGDWHKKSRFISGFFWKFR